MRVIAGLHRSRTLEAPRGLATRPTSDRLRETLFNVLAPRVEGARFLDLYAGSGAVGIEAVSRGAARVEFVERAKPALDALRANLRSLKIGSGISVHAVAVREFLRCAPDEPFDIVFLDPPYEAEAEYASALNLLGSAQEWLVPEGVVIAEHRRKEALAEEYGVLRRTRLLEQGDAGLSFYGALAG